MDHIDISLLIHRVCSGKFFFCYNNKEYYLQQPSPELKYRSEIFYANFIEENKYSVTWNKDNISSLLSNLQIWTYANEQQLKNLEKRLENLKVVLYEDRMSSVKIKRHKNDINFIKQSINKMLTKKHYLDYLTIEDMASVAKNEYVLMKTIFDNNNNIVFNDNIENTDYSFFMNLASIISSNFISIENYKTVARSEQWKAIWNSNKNNIFNKSAYELNDEQKTLISISNMYDRIIEHPESPEENVINDDDMLDGWMIIQKNKAEKLKKDNKANQLASKHKNAKEIFVVAEPEEVHEILSLNSSQSIMDIKRRNKAIEKSTDGVDEVFLPDVQEALLNQINSKRR